MFGGDGGRSDQHVAHDEVGMLDKHRLDVSNWILGCSQEAVQGTIESLGRDLARRAHACQL
jgi:hypothetical protein